MDSIRIEAKVIDHRDPSFWYRAELNGCQLQKTHGSQEERFAAGYAQAEPGTLLAFSIAGGDPEFEYHDYWILRVDPQQPDRTLGGGDHSYPHGFLRGPFEILAHARGKECATRLKQWWLEWAPQHGGQTAAMARWLGPQASQGQEKPLGSAPPAGVHDVLFNSLEAWSFR